MHDGDLHSEMRDRFMSVDRMQYTIGYKRGRAEGVAGGVLVGLFAAAALAFVAHRYVQESDLKKRVTREFIEQNPQYRIKKTRSSERGESCTGFSSSEVLLVENKTNGSTSSILACGASTKASQFVFQRAGRF
jgi:hypothetical protein